MMIVGRCKNQILERAILTQGRTEDHFDFDIRIRTKRIKEIQEISPGITDNDERCQISIND